MRLRRCLPYRDIDGNHWPDTNLGDSLYYSIDYSQWITEENDSLISVDWVIPEGLFGEDAHEEDLQAIIKLTPDKRGTFKVICNLLTEEDNKQQTKSVEMRLKVL